MMGAVVVALAVMMWMWTAVGLHLSGWLERSGNHPVRMAYLVVIVALGATALLLPLWLVLPGSVLSAGWTLKELQGTQQSAALFVVLAALAGIARGHLLFRPASRPKPVVVKAAAKAAQKKRRP